MAKEKMSLQEQANRILEQAQEKGVQSNFFFVTTFKRYQVQMATLAQLDDLLPFLREGVEAVDSRLVDVVVLSEPSVVLHRAHREHLSLLKPPENRVEGGLRNLDIRLYGFDYSVAVAVLVSDGSKNADVDQSPF